MRMAKGTTGKQSESALSATLPSSVDCMRANTVVAVRSTEQSDQSLERYTGALCRCCVAISSPKPTRLATAVELHTTGSSSASNHGSDSTHLGIALAQHNNGILLRLFH